MPRTDLNISSIRGLFRYYQCFAGVKDTGNATENTTVRILLLLLNECYGLLINIFSSFHCLFLRLANFQNLYCCLPVSEKYTLHSLKGIVQRIISGVDNMLK
jgi:hypothetical protein